MIIDAQVHPYGRRHPDSPAARAPSAGPLEVNGDHLVTAMDELGIDGAICVSPWGEYHTDTSFAESVYKGHPDRFRLVAPIDSKAAGVEARVREWASTPGAVGVRLLFVSEHTFDAVDPGVKAAIDTAAAVNLPVNVHCWGRLSLMAELARQYPDARLVIDHLGLTQPLLPPAPEGALADLPQLLALARYPNLAVKITGACTYSRRSFPYDDLWEPLARVIDSFGVDRCMWGTDWTRTTKILTYEQGFSRVPGPLAHGPIRQSRPHGRNRVTHLQLVNGATQPGDLRRHVPANHALGELLVCGRWLLDRSRRGHLEHPQLVGLGEGHRRQHGIRHHVRHHQPGVAQEPVTKPVALCRVESLASLFTGREVGSGSFPASQHRHSYSAAFQLQPEGARRVLHAGIGRRIRQMKRPRVNRRERSDEQDVTAGPGVSHGLNPAASHKQSSGELRGYLYGYLGGGEIVQRTVSGGGGVIDDDVDRPELLFGAAKELLDRIPVSDIEVVGEALPTSLHHQLRRLG